MVVVVHNEASIGSAIVNAVIFAMPLQKIRQSRLILEINFIFVSSFSITIVIMQR